MIFPLKFLPKHEAFLLMEIVYKFSTIETCDDYRNLFNDLNFFIPFDYATSGLVVRNNRGVVQSYDLLNINFTEDWISAYDEQKIYLVDVTVEENFKYFKTQCWRETYKKYDNPKKLLSFAHDYNLTNGYSCGAKAFGLYKKPSMISFVWNFEEKCEYISSIIDYITPYIHIALSNVLCVEMLMTKREILTGREKEVASWVKMGKSSWEISVMLKISEATVNYHIANIMNKLNSANRVQAVAIALQYGIIDFD